MLHHTDPHAASLISQQKSYHMPPTTIKAPSPLLSIPADTVDQLITGQLKCTFTSREPHSTIQLRAMPESLLVIQASFSLYS